MLCEYFPFLDRDKLLPRYPERHLDSVSLQYTSAQRRQGESYPWLFWFSFFSKLRDCDIEESDLGIIELRGVEGGHFKEVELLFNF